MIVADPENVPFFNHVQKNNPKRSALRVVLYHFMPFKIGESGL